MHNTTRQKFTAYSSHLALLSGVSVASATFNVAPQVEQTAEKRIRESSEFLQMINVVPVINGNGQVLDIGTTGSIASRTDTSGGQRLNPADPVSHPEKIKYTCEKTDYNWKRSYDSMDAWRHMPEFEVLLRDAIIEQQALDRLTIGFNGKFVAENTDSDTYPLLEDVNIGWLEQIRLNAPEQVFDDGNLTVYNNGENNPDVKAIYVYPDVEFATRDGGNKTTAKADYSSLDALVKDAKSSIHPRFRNSADLVVIVGHDLIDDKYFNIAQEAGNTATEVEATYRLLSSTKQLGGLKAYGVHSFPANAILITTMANLSIYYQEGTRRRRLADEPEYERIANYESVREAYVVQEYIAAVLIENVELGVAPNRVADPNA